MVSLNTIITLGGIGAAYVLFTKLGGGVQVLVPLLVLKFQDLQKP